MFPWSRVCGADHVSHPLLVGEVIPTTRRPLRNAVHARVVSIPFSSGKLFLRIYTPSTTGMGRGKVSIPFSSGKLFRLSAGIRETIVFIGVRRLGCCRSSRRAASEVSHRPCSLIFGHCSVPVAAVTRKRSFLSILCLPRCDPAIANVRGSHCRKTLLRLPAWTAQRQRPAR